jgi:PAS domain S-box-containing protein
MFDFGSIPLGIALIFLGILFFVGALIFVRLISGRINMRGKISPSSISQELPEHQEAVMVIQPGGRVSYLNQAAREKFKVWQETPNLERLARQTRPIDAFLSLCSTEGVAPFSIDGQKMEGVSYSVPNGNGKAVLLTIRSRQPGAISNGSIESSDQTLEIMTSLSQSLQADLELDTTLEGILTSGEQLVPNDFSEIAIWDAEKSYLTPYRFVGIKGMDWQVRAIDQRYPLGAGYSGRVAELREPILINDVDLHREFSPLVNRQEHPFHSYLGIPLLVANKLIGTLNLTSLDRNAFTESDIEVMTLFSGQAAVALQNALLFREEKRRAVELSRLANLTQKISSAQNSKALFARLAQGISPLLDVEIAGFLLFDDLNRTLVAQKPFIGVPSEFVELYKVEIVPESRADIIWRDQEVLVISNAGDDPQMADLGLDHSARAAGISHTVLMPLKSGGRSLGYLQAANKRDGTPFTDDDVRLLSIIAGQAAPIIENADLIQQSVQRALRAEALRRIASLSGSEAGLDEILKYSVIELSRLLRADLAAIFFFDENLAELTLHRESIYGVVEDVFDRFGKIVVDEHYSKFIVSVSQEPFLSENILIDQRVLPPFEQLINSINIQSAMGVPLIFHGRGLGELILASKTPGHFNRSDIQLAMTVAGQLAVAIERTSLASHTDEDLRRRVDQLTALTRIGRQLNTSGSLTQLLNYIYEETLKTTGAECGTILLFDNLEPGAEYPKIRLHIGDEVGTDFHPLERVAIKKNEPVLIEDYNQPPKSLDDSTIHPAHKGVNSALVVPIVYQGSVVGLFNLHSTQPRHFDSAAMQIVQALAVQAAVAIGNVKRFEDQKHSYEMLQKRADTLSSIIRSPQDNAQGYSAAAVMPEIVANIQQAISSPAILIGICNQDDNLSWVGNSGFSVELSEKVNQDNFEWAPVTKYLRAEYQLNSSYFVPWVDIDQNADWIGSLLKHNGVDSSWGNLLLLPLINSSSDPLGLMIAFSSASADSADRTLLENLDDFSHYLSVLVDDLFWAQQLENQVHGLEAQLDDRKADIIQVLQQEDIQRSQARVESVLEIIELLSRQPDRNIVLKTLGQEFHSRLGFDRTLVIEWNDGGPQLLHLFGDVPKKINVQALLGQRNPASESINQDQLYLMADLSESDPWSQSPLIQALSAKGFISLPIIAQAGSPAAVLGMSVSELSEFTPEDERLFGMLASQSASTLNTLTLLTETGHRLKEVYLLLDFSRQLGGVDIEKVVHLLVESSIEVVSHAQAGMFIEYLPVLKSLSARTAIGYVNNEEMLGISFQPGEGLIGKAFDERKATRVKEVEFSQNYHLTQEDLMRYRTATGEKFPISSMVLPVSTGIEMLGLLVLDNFDQVDAFSMDDQALVSSLCRQAALTLENISLYSAADQRAAQLETLSTISAVMTSTLEYDGLVSSLLEVLENLMPFDTGTLWLRHDDMLRIHSARGFENSDDLIGIETAVKESRLFAEIVEKNVSVNIGDIRQDDRFPENAHERLSWLAVPLFSKGILSGVIALEKKEINYYDSESIQILTTFSSQAAVALENAELYNQSLDRTQQLDRRSQRLALINRFSEQISSTLDLDTLLHITCREMKEALPSSVISVVLNHQGQFDVQYEIPQKVEQFPWELPDAPIIGHLRQSLGVFSTADVAKEETLRSLKPYFDRCGTKALLVLPLETGAEVHGFIFVQSAEAYRYSTADVELGLILSNQAAVAVQNAMLFTQTRHLTAELEERVEERTELLEKEHLRAQALLRIMEELSASLDLDHVLNRTLNLLNDITQAEQSTILLIRPNEDKFYYRTSLGYTNPPPPGGRSTELDIGEGLAGWIVRHRKGVLIADLKDDDRWFYTADLDVEHRSAMGVPLMVGAELLGVMLMFHRHENHFTAEQKETSQAAANQIGVSINNAELFNLIREQAERLGSMLRTQEVETSRSRAILEAVADGVLVTDADSQITLFNGSAQNVLGLQRDEVVGKSLEGFSGLFGGAARMWLDTIQALSSAPTHFDTGDTFSEQIMLDDGRIVSVHLAPVRLLEEFLGTVSIFRDITHQVEVDRLKSEFVATVSHELRTPMTSIKGYVEILLMGAAGELSDQQTKFLEIVHSNTRRLNILVNDLLDVSRMDAGKVDLSIQPLRLQKLAVEVVNEQIRRSEIEEKPLSIEYQIPVDLPRVLGDEERVRQILANLVGNAYHYTPPSGHVRVKAHLMEDEVRVDVTDDGIGIHPDDQERVFERFYRGEDPLVLATAGTGLGLAIVHQLIEMHHGRIWLTSKGVPGEGSTFSFTLPIYKEED